MDITYSKNRPILIYLLGMIHISAYGYYELGERVCTIYDSTDRGEKRYIIPLERLLYIEVHQEDYEISES
jgi:hypothetical protein